MRKFIRRCLERVIPLLTPRPTGRHTRACLAVHAPAASPSRPQAPVTPAPARHLPPLFDDPIAGEEPDIVRPYVRLHEKQRERERGELARQAQRRGALYLALHGLDAGPRWIHGAEVAAR